MMSVHTLLPAAEPAEATAAAAKAFKEDTRPLMSRGAWLRLLQLGGYLIELLRREVPHVLIELRQGVPVGPYKLLQLVGLRSVEGELLGEIATGNADLTAINVAVNGDRANRGEVLGRTVGVGQGLLDFDHAAVGDLKARQVWPMVQWHSIRYSPSRYCTRLRDSSAGTPTLSTIS